MKFLLFNVVVIGALAYLAINPNGMNFFASGSTDPALAVTKEEIAAKAKEMYEHVYAERLREAEKFFSIFDKEITEEASKTVADTAPTPVKKPVPAETVSAPAQKAPALTETKEVQVVAIHKAPSPANPVGTGKAIVTAQKTQTKPTYMTPRQRARELNRLVRDMEIFFADKLTN
jgi:hypothetical protein